jgi:hypothetical protein
MIESKTLSLGMSEHSMQVSGGSPLLHNGELGSQG